MTIIHNKLDKLLRLLQELGSVAIGFSGGVDSSFLAAAAYRALGTKAIAITAYSATLPRSELEEATAVAKHIGIEHQVLESNELAYPEFIANTAQRCYYCKKVRFTELTSWAAQAGYCWVLEGSIADDLAEFRPGMKAVQELANVRSPLLEVRLTKQDIRILSQEWGLSTFNKLSSACLATRLAYGLEITVERLQQVEIAEDMLKKIFAGQVRVRHHGNLARIEVHPENFSVLNDKIMVRRIATELQQIGFTFATVDLNGYQTGSMDKTLNCLTPTDLRANTSI